MNSQKVNINKINNLICVIEVGIDYMRNQYLDYFHTKIL